VRNGYYYCAVCWIIIRLNFVYVFNLAHEWHTLMSGTHSWVARTHEWHTHDWHTLTSGTHSRVTHTHEWHTLTSGTHSRVAHTPERHTLMSGTHSRVAHTHDWHTLMTGTHSWLAHTPTHFRTFDFVSPIMPNFVCAFRSSTIEILETLAGSNKIR